MADELAQGWGVQIGDGPGDTELTDPDLPGTELDALQMARPDEPVPTVPDSQDLIPEVAPTNVFTPATQMTPEREHAPVAPATPAPAPAEDWFEDKDSHAREQISVPAGVEIHSLSDTQGRRSDSRVDSRPRPRVSRTEPDGAFPICSSVTSPTPRRNSSSFRRHERSGSDACANGAPAAAVTPCGGAHAGS